MTKADIVENIYERVGFLKRDVSEVVELVFETIKEALAKGEEVKISGFATFTVRQKRDRRGRNPQTGKDMTITARKVLSFKPSHITKDKMNP
ncbi:MAG: integration host factor subunit alpha [Deltaproteobacteria bacterium]|nr:integration host factor subunit alpha [Deltaproteobacteria bacterium]